MIISNKEITLNVPQGLGDIFWIYQKMSPNFEKININICYFDELTEIKKRSILWLKTFPKIGKTSFLKIKEQNYKLFFNKFFALKNLLKIKTNSYFYSVNCPLERGIRIEDIDKEFNIDFNIDLKFKEFNLDFENYCILYVSGSVESNYDYLKWINLVNLIYEKYNFNFPLYLLGSNFDLNILEKISNNININNVLFIDKMPEEVIFLIKNAKYFIGHQSGLNVLADNYNIKQLMIYYDKLNKLTESWPKKENIINKIYNYNFFSKNPKEIVDLL